MNLLATLEATFTALDSAAFALLILAWLATGFVAEHPPAWRPSVSHLMKDYRRRWMVEFLTRDPRVVERKKYGKAKARKSFQFSKR